MDLHDFNEIGFQEGGDLLIGQFSLTGREMIIQAVHIVKMDSDHPIRVGVKEILVAAYPQVFVYAGMPDVMPVPHVPALKFPQDNPDLLVIGDFVEMVPVFDAEEYPLAFGLVIQLFQAKENGIQILPVFAFPDFPLFLQEGFSLVLIYPFALTELSEALHRICHIHVAQVQNYSLSFQVIGMLNCLKGCLLYTSPSPRD